MGENSVTLGENSVLIGSGAFSDPDGDALTYRMADAPDSGLVGIEDDGRLTFTMPVDFEHPRDADGNNSYRIAVEATDARGASTTQQIDIRVTDRTGSQDRRYVHYTLPNVSESANIEFGSVMQNGQTVSLRMDVFRPAGDTETRRPVIVFAFGGGFVTGDRGTMRKLAIDFARRGYVTASVDYRLMQSAAETNLDYYKGAADAMQDVAAAVRFFREDGETTNRYGVDPGKIFVAGNSAGGIIAGGLATLELDDLEPGNPVRNYLEENGGVAGRSSSNYDRVSSDIQGALVYGGAILNLDFIDERSKPIFAAHNELDPIVPCGTGPDANSSTGLLISGGCAIAERYAASGLPGDLFLVPGSTRHTQFDVVERNAIAQEAGALFVANVIGKR